jgi:hypothetical protein
MCQNDQSLTIMHRYKLPRVGLRAKGNGIIKMKWYWEHVREHIENFGNRLVGATHWVHTYMVPHLIC